jgi:hypothetical protein
MRKNIILALVTLGLALGNVGLTAAQDKAKENSKDEEKTTSVANKVTGQISSINKNSIAVVYKRDEAKGEEFEMLFPIDKNLRVVHKKNIAELAVGDTVEVQFEDVTIEMKDRKEGKRNTTVLTFISRSEQPAETISGHNEANSTESVSVPPLKSELR